MPTDAHKTIAGALLAGAGLLSGNAVLLTVAAGVGVNWTSEGLAGLWRRAVPGTPLSQAATRAIRRAVDQLRAEYQRQAGPNPDLRAFTLVRECAGAVADAPLPDADTPLALQQALAAALDELLHGHDPRAAAFLRASLLPMVSQAFQAELAGDDQAWRAFHHALSIQLAGQQALTGAELQRLATALAALAGQHDATLAAAADRLDALLDELHAALARLGELPAGVTFTNRRLRVGGQLRQAGGSVGAGGAAPAAPGGGTGPVRFENEDVQVTGDVTQAGGDIYINSAHVQGGTAFVINSPGGPPPPGAPPAAEAAPLLLELSFEPEPAGARVRWQSEVLGRTASTFAPPYAPADLPLVLRALDALQYPRLALDLDGPAQLRPVFTPAEQARLAAAGLWADNRLAPDSHQRVGRALFAALTGDPLAASALATVRTVATALGRPLALALRFPRDAVELAALPWELLWDALPVPLLLGHPAQPASLARHLDLGPLPPPQHRSGPLRVLLVSPHAGIPAEVRAETHAALQAAWQPLVAAGQLRLEIASPAPAGVIGDAVRALQPDIIHFFGHGLYRPGQGGILEIDGPGGAQALTANRLMVLFGGARLVVLHACQGAQVAPGAGDLLTGVAPALSAAGVPLVIGMQLTIRAEAATRACAVIYTALSRHQSIQHAVTQARQALYTEEPDQCSWYVPALYLATRDTGPAHV